MNRSTKARQFGAATGPFACKPRRRPESSTVFDDGALDSLQGDNGRDRFFADLDGLEDDKVKSDRGRRKRLTEQRHPLHLSPGNCFLIRNSEFIP